jgi:hypothetical protein
MVRVPGSRILEMPASAKLGTDVNVDDAVIVTIDEHGQIVDWRPADN